jgi:transcriptional regulator with XRE-family HTH domain
LGGHFRLLAAFDNSLSIPDRFHSKAILNRQFGCVNYLFMLNTSKVVAVRRKLFVYNKMTFGDWLREKIADRGVSNAELGRRVGVSATYIGNLVRDYSPNKRKPGRSRPSEPVVEAIANALGAPVDEARVAAGYAPTSPQDALVAFLNSTELTDAEREELAKSIRRQIAGMKAERDAEGVE